MNNAGRFWGPPCAAALTAMLALGACNKPAPAKAPAAPATAPAPAAPPPAAALDPAEAASAKAFLEALYAHYKTTKNNTFQPLGDNVRDVFDADMVKLLDEDQKLLKGELGEIDGDWVCQCQDFESITATIAVQSADATTAKATADFQVFEQKHHNDFELVKQNGAWRVHDIREPPQPSLREVLQKEIKTLSAPGQKP
ncbi:MAG TPA: DUF3828 domain-containing protein [Caulobacteraceae bacterium]|nr:DUF3828 domain-containing protein [Caulobacteraceae bacterium]